jgi:hypothetical protein
VTVASTFSLARGADLCDGVAVADVKRFALFTKLAILYVTNKSKIDDLLRFRGAVRASGVKTIEAAYVLKNDGASDYFIDRKKAKTLIQMEARTKEAGWMEVRMARNQPEKSIERRRLVWAELLVQGY